jgi:hypothetical protein
LRENTSRKSGERGQSARHYNLAALSRHLNEVYRQALIKVDLKDLGTIDLTGDEKMKKAEDKEYPKTKFQEGTTSVRDMIATSAMHNAANKELAKRTAEPLPRAGARRLYWYVPTVGAEWGGMVPSIGHSATFVFSGDGPAARNTCAHEFGHSLKLRHPSDALSTTQFALHNRSSKNKAVPGYDGTNTEPESLAAAKASNVMANDPTNLMGYWDVKAARKYLRYHQWKAASRS